MDNEILNLTLLFIASYLIGSFPSAFIIVKAFRHQDVTKHGTGNVGTMNTHRATGSKILAIMVLLLDVGKGLLAWFIAKQLSQNYELGIDEAELISGLAVILGHNYSIMMKFKGGKGLATAAGFAIFFEPAIIAIWLISWVIITGITRYFVLGQMIATIFSAIASWFIFPDKALSTTLISLPVIIKHAPRMIDVFKGHEPTMYYKKKNP